MVNHLNKVLIVYKNWEQKAALTQMNTYGKNKEKDSVFKKFNVLCEVIHNYVTYI